MSEAAKQAIEELVEVIEGNDLAKAFLKGYKSGIETAGQKRKVSVAGEYREMGAMEDGAGGRGEKPNERGGRAGKAGMDPTGLHRVVAARHSDHG